MKKITAGKYINKVQQKIAQEGSKPKESYSLNPLNEIFKGDPLEKALELRQKEIKQVQDNDDKQKKVKKHSKKQLRKKVEKRNSKKKKKN